MTWNFTVGRQLIWLVALPIICVGTFGAASAHDIQTLLLFRMIQAFGSAPGLSVLVPGIIADIYSLEERGTAMGIFFSVRTSG